MSRLRALSLVWSSDYLIPPSERYIFNFNSKDELKQWHLYSDSEYGEYVKKMLCYISEGSQ
uniref:Uncharacterized protein n=1 Tax=Setaria italica TaxID=4555 RepID=K3ZBN1_SETIT